MLGYLVTSKPVGPIKGERIYFHTFIYAQGDWPDTVFFPPAAKIYNVSGKGFYALTGKAIKEFGVHTLDVQHSKKTDIKKRAEGKANFIFYLDEIFDF